MVTVALFVRLEAKPGKAKEVEDFLRGGLPIVQEKPATTAWFGIRLGPTTFGIFDAFPDEAGRQAHLAGRVAAALMARAFRAAAHHREGRRPGGKASPGMKEDCLPMTSVLRARTIGETRGFMKALIDARSDRILGFIMLGAEAVFANV